MASRRVGRNGNDRRRAGDGRWAELDQRLREVSNAVERTNRSVDKLTGSWGRFVEGMVEPSWIGYLERRGIKLARVMRDVKATVNGENAEYDLVIVSPAEVFVLEAKTTVSSADVEEFATRHFGRFFEFFPEYRGRQLRGAIAGMRFGEGADVRASRKGFYVLRPSGEVMKVSPPARPATQPPGAAG